MVRMWYYCYIWESNILLQSYILALPKIGGRYLLLSLKVGNFLQMSNHVLIAHIIIIIFAHSLEAILFSTQL